MTTPTLRELTTEDIAKLAAQLPPEEKDAWFYVHPKVKKHIDRVWKKLPWYVKLWINIRRLFNGVGLYE